jgi:nitrogen fixation protein
MKLMRNGMESENQKMRRLISVYIQSSDLNDPAWEVMEEDDLGGTAAFVFVNCVCNVL